MKSGLFMAKDIYCSKLALTSTKIASNSTISYSFTAETNLVEAAATASKAAILVKDIVCVGGIERLKSNTSKTNKRARNSYRERKRNRINVYSTKEYVYLYICI